MAKSKPPSKGEQRASTPVLGGRVRYALSRIVDFDEPRRLQTDAARQFKERWFHDAFQAARKAVFRIEGESRDYVESGMALAIASARHILETSEGTTEWARKVSDPSILIKTRRLKGRLAGLLGEAEVPAPEHRRLRLQTSKERSTNPMGRLNMVPSFGSVSEGR